MNRGDTNSQIKKSTTNDKDNALNSQHKRERLKAKIMDKFDVSLDEAENILLNLENRSNNNVSKKSVKIKDDFKQSKDSNHVFKRNLNANTKDIRLNSGKNLNNGSLVSNEKLNTNTSKSNIYGVSDHLNRNFKKQSVQNNQVVVTNSNGVVSVNNHGTPSISQKQKIEFNQEEINNNPSNTDKSFDEVAHTENVDSILENIVSDYDKKISIKVDHIDLTFEVQNEKVDTLKEAFIRTLKRKKSKKIKIHALNDVSFEIYKGEKVGVIGYNGAGKSTLLGAITGIHTPDKGKITTYGRISPLLSLGAGFDHNFSGRKNIMLNGAVLGYDKSFLESKVDEIIEFSELGEYIDIPIKNYSSGMLAKLGFSIATIVEPDILIIDEVLGVGDITFQKKCRDKIMSLMDGGTTVLLVSHAIPQIRQLCDKAIWIDNGRLRAMGEVNKICDKNLKDAEKATKEQLANIQFK